jgi:type IV pilus assembly protein PilA
MKSRKGFTLIELMVVVLIVGILAAVAIPIMRGRIDAAKWSEGRAGMGTIATALRAYAAEQSTDGTYGASLPTLATLGFIASDLEGTYFSMGDYSIVTSAFTAGANPELTYTIRCDCNSLTPAYYTLTEAGQWGHP